jgi:2-oxoglutarate ferredoxin oxidoreductase subunit gamma
MLLIDSDFVKREPKGDFKTIKFPIISTAKNEVGREIVANVVALGAMVALTGIVSREAGEKAVIARVPEAFIELNKKAYNTGYEKVKSLTA